MMKLLMLPLLGLTLLIAAAQETRPYSIDPVHSAMFFRIQWNNLSPFYGTFNEMSGTMRFDGTPDSFQCDITVPVASIDSNNEQRDRHLKSPDFFNAREFPEIRFVSKDVAANDDGTFTLVGDLTLHGQTKEVEAILHSVNAGELRGDQRCGADVTLTINRSDFGMSYGIEEGALGDEVTLHIGLQGVMN